MADEKRVFIAVHPFNAYGLHDGNPDFVRKRAERLSDLSLEHVLLVNHSLRPGIFYPDIKVAEENLGLSKNPYWHGRVFLTHDEKLATDYFSKKRLCLAELSEAIQKRFPAGKYLIWGAILHRPPSYMAKPSGLASFWEGREPYGGIPYYHRMLALKNKEIDEEYCLQFAA